MKKEASGGLLLGWKHHHVDQNFDSTKEAIKQEKTSLLQSGNHNKSKKGSRRWGLGKIERDSSSDSSMERLVSEYPVYATTNESDDRHARNTHDSSESDSDSKTDSNNTNVSGGASGNDSDDELSYESIESTKGAGVQAKDDQNFPQNQKPQLKQQIFMNRFNKKGEQNMNTSLLSNTSDAIQDYDNDDDFDNDNDNVTNYTNKIQGFGCESTSNTDLQSRKVFSGFIEAFQKRRLRARGEFDAEGLSRQEIDLLKRDVEMENNTATMQSMDIIAQDPLDKKGGKLRWKQRVKTLAAAAFAPEEYLDHLVDPENGDENKGFYLNLPLGDDNDIADDMDLQEKNMRQMKIQGERMNVGDVVQLLQDEPQLDQYCDEEPRGFYNSLSGNAEQTDLYSRLSGENRCLLNQVAQLEGDLKLSKYETEAWRLEAKELQKKLDAVVASKTLADKLSDSDEEDIMIRVDNDEESDSSGESESDSDEEDMINMESDAESGSNVKDVIDIKSEEESESEYKSGSDEEEMTNM